MDRLQIALGILLGMYASLGLIHLWVAKSKQAARANWIFAACSVVAAAHVLADMFMYWAPNIDAYAAALRWQIFTSQLWILCVVGFLVVYTGSVRKGFPWVIGAVCLVTCAVNFLHDHSLVFSEITSLRQVPMPWGGEISLAIGNSTPWRLVLDVSVLLVFLCITDTTIRIFRSGRRAMSLRVGGALILLSLAGGIGGALVDMGKVNLPYLTDFVFLGMLAVLSRELAIGVVRASELSSTVAANEARWSTLLEKVHLLIVELDHRGRIRYTNPFFRKVTGYSAEETIGKGLVDLVAVRERNQVESQLEAAISGEVLPSHETSLLASDNSERRVLWSNVLLEGEQSRVSGVLSVGADVTRQRLAEAARDVAIGELEEFKRRLEAENIYLTEELQREVGSDEIIGESNALTYVLHRIHQVAPTESTVLILGETGVGKELVAKAIHRSSARCEKPFLRVNCAALPANLIESELFGHERGAFTGANDLRKGRFELADGGTLLLDEVGDLPLEVQPKLLRVLQEGEIDRVGSSGTRKVSVRVIAATNRDLEEDVREGRFRQDLYYRLNVYPITVPPLRNRKQDISLLTQHFVPMLALRHHKEVRTIPGHVMLELAEYAWPGNVRELLNVLERAVITTQGPVLQLGQPLVSLLEPESSGDGESFRTLLELEREHIRKVLDSTGGRISGPKGAATILGLHPNTLRSRMSKFGLDRVKS